MNVFTPHLKHKATIQRATYATGADGQQSKTFANLYVNIDCNLKRDIRSGQRRKIIGEEESVIVRWRLDVGSEYSGATRGDRAVIWPAAGTPSEGRTFEVVDTEKKIDFFGNTAFYYIYLEETE